VADNGSYPFPTPDWLTSNASWVATETDLYYKSRQGKWTNLHKSRQRTDTGTPGPLTIPYFSGSIVTFLPLQNTTSDYRQMIQDAAAVDLATILPAGADPTILAGWRAQRDLILNLYASPQATVAEIAFGGGNTVPIAMLKPLSRGSILINSTDPLAPPLFDYGTFMHPTDLAIAVQALKKTREWMASEPMQEVGALETNPGTNVTTDEEIAASIRTFASSTWAHPVGTLSMMKKEYGGVVDSKLCVYGVQGLRVVDASIMPLIPATHTSSTVYAVAEKVRHCLRDH